MKPSLALETNRLEVLDLIARYPFKNPRIFGSVSMAQITMGAS
jgi:hypothetical protein